jgi:hypothetical protein
VWDADEVAGRVAGGDLQVLVEVLREELLVISTSETRRAAAVSRLHELTRAVQARVRRSGEWVRQHDDCAWHWAPAEGHPGVACGVSIPGAPYVARRPGPGSVCQVCARASELRYASSTPSSPGPRPAAKYPRPSREPRVADASWLRSSYPDGHTAVAIRDLGREYGVLVTDPAAYLWAGEVLGCAYLELPPEAPRGGDPPRYVPSHALWGLDGGVWHWSPDGSTRQACGVRGRTDATVPDGADPLPCCAVCLAARASALHGASRS